MKQTTKTKSAVLMLIALLLVACVLICFAACNNDAPSDDDFSISLDTIDSAILNQALTGGIGYIAAHKNEYSECYLDCKYSLSNAAPALVRTSTQDFPALLTLSISLFNYDDNVANKAFACQLMFFESEQKATDSFNALKESYGNSALLTKDRKLIVMESAENVYDAIKKSTVAENSADSERLNFYKTALKNELTEKTATLEASYSAHDDERFYCITRPKKGNVVNRYIYGSTEFFGELEASDVLKEDYLDNYSEDSYVKKTNDTYYFYASPKLGFHFAKTAENTAYVATDYYYDDDISSLVIPATYNEKPVVEIANITIPASVESVTFPNSITKLDPQIFDSENLKLINFEGTKAQWKTIVAENNLTNLPSDIKTECSDGEFDSSETINAQLQTSIEQLIGFVLTNTSPELEVGFGFIFSNTYIDVEEGGINCLGYYYVYEYVESHDTMEYSYVFVYDTEENAIASIQTIKDLFEYPGEVIYYTQHKNTITVENNQKDLISKLHQSYIPENNSLSENALTFIKEHLTYPIPQQFGCISGGLTAQGNNNFYFTSTKTPSYSIDLNGDDTISYHYFSNKNNIYDYILEDIERIGIYFSEDSWVKEEDDEVYICLIKKNYFAQQTA